MAEKVAIAKSFDIAEKVIALIRKIIHHDCI